MGGQNLRMTNQKLITMNRPDGKREYCYIIAEYLAELSKLCGESVSRENLLSPDETAEIRKQALKVNKKPILRFDLPFFEIKTEKFANYIRKLYETNSDHVYIWTPRTAICGTYEIDSISKFNFHFPFDINEEGLIVILTKNLQDEMTLDFSKNEIGEEVLEIEVRGIHWSGINWL